MGQAMGSIRLNAKAPAAADAACPDGKDNVLGREFDTVVATACVSYGRGLLTTGLITMSTSTKVMTIAKVRRQRPPASRRWIATTAPPTVQHIPAIAALDTLTIRVVNQAGWGRALIQRNREWSAASSWSITAARFSISNVRPGLSWAPVPELVRVPYGLEFQSSRIALACREAVS